MTVYVRKLQLVSSRTRFDVSAVSCCTKRRAHFFNASTFSRLGNSGKSEADGTDVDREKYRCSAEIGYSDNSVTKVRNVSGQWEGGRLTDNATRASFRRRTIALSPNAYHFPANFRPPKAKILFPSYYA